MARSPSVRNLLLIQTCGYACSWVRLEIEIGLIMEIDHDLVIMMCVPQNKSRFNKVIAILT